MGPAISAMETMGLLDGLPATAAAFREGRLSLAQVSEIADVASEWPATEQRLLDAAEVMSLAELREEDRILCQILSMTVDLDDLDDAGDDRLAA